MTKKLPSSAGAERYVITACLKEPDTIVNLGAVLRPEDFYYNIYKYTYQVCIALVETGMKPEPMTIYNRLEAMGMAKPEYLKELEVLSKASYDKQNLDDYVETMRNYSARRQLFDALESSKNEILENNELTAVESVDLCEDKILTVGNKMANIKDVYKLGSDTLGVLSIRANNPLEIPGIPTGFPSLDEDLQGLQPGRLYVLTARQKVGKSIFLMNIVRNVAVKNNIPVLIIDTEMTSSQVDDRMLSLITGIEQQKLTNGMFALEKDAPEKVMKGLDILSAANIYHYYMTDFSFEKVLSLVRKYKLQKNIGLVVFDYIKMPDDTEFGSVKEHQMIGYLTSNLKNKIAGSLGVPVLTAAQLGRSAIGATDTSDEHIADSDRIGRYADSIIYLREKTEEEREKYGYGPTQGNMVASVHLSRYGPSKDRAYDMYFNKPVMSFKEVKARKI